MLHGVWRRIPLAACAAAHYRQGNDVGWVLGTMTSELDRLYAALQAGGDAAGLAFYRALADAELFVLLEVEAEGAVVTPRVFDLAEAAVLLAFDSEERLAGFAVGPQPYAALPGRVVAGQMVGQNLSLGLNLGSGAASEVILPPEAIDWLVQMLDQAPPLAVAARVQRFEVPMVPQAVLAALPAALAGVGRACLVGVRYDDGRRGQMLALTGVAAGAEAKVARAVTEAMGFSGVEAGALDVAFLAADDPLLAAMAGLALVFEGQVAEAPDVTGPTGPGMDPARPPYLR